MTSLDKALIKVYERGHARKRRRPVEPSHHKPARELYVDPASDDLPSPTIAHPATLEELTEEIESESDHGSPIDESIAVAETANFVTGDLIPSLESFVVHQEFDIPILEEIDTVVTESNSHTVSDSMPRPFNPAWEVDSFELPDSAVQMNSELGPQIDQFISHLRQTTTEAKKLVTFHSLSRGEGRTTLSITLAMALAQTGVRVLLVDADFDNPSLANRLGLAVEIGWEKAIAGEVPIAECSVRSIGDAFTILPLSDTATDEDHLILRDALRNLLAELVGRFDLILVDTGPGRPILDEIFDTMIATRIAVRDIRRTDSRLMMQFMSSLKANTDQIVEAIDNFA